MAAGRPDPLDEREQRTLDALAHHDPDFAARMAAGPPGRAARARRTGDRRGTTLREVVLVAVLILLAVVVGVAALVVGTGGVLLLGLFLAGGTGAMAAYRLHRQSREP